MSILVFIADSLASSGKKTIIILLQAHREGYIAIVMPKPADWVKVKESLLSLEEYKRLREV